MVRLVKSILSSTENSVGLLHRTDSHTGLEIGWIRVSKSVRIRYHIRIGHDDSVKFSQKSQLCCNISAYMASSRLFMCRPTVTLYRHYWRSFMCKFDVLALVPIQTLIRKPMLCASSLINYISDFAVVGLCVWWCNRRSHIVVFLGPRTHQTSSAGVPINYMRVLIFPLMCWSLLCQLQCKTAVVKTNTNYYFPRCTGPLKRGSCGMCHFCHIG